MASRFLRELDATLKGDKIWVLNTMLSYTSDLLNCTVSIPAGFETDLSSVPRLPLIFWFWGGKAHREGVLHDALYRSDVVPCVSRAVADDVFLEAMKSRDKPWNIRYPMWMGVRAGGWASYHKKKMFDKL